MPLAAEQVPQDSAASQVGYFSYETIQLTTQVIADLKAQNVGNPAILDFADAEATYVANGSEPNCKVFPGDPEWPSDSEWQGFDRLLGGALIKGVPSAAVCYSDWPQYDPEKCTEVTNAWLDPVWQ